MYLAGVELHDFRSYERACSSLSEGMTVLTGANGAGKSNLLEAICFGCTGRSPRTRNDRELIRFGASAARVELRLLAADGVSHELAVGFGVLGQEGRMEKRMSFDAAPVESLREIDERPLVSVFVPDRLELINGPPALRRSHVDNLVSALWPSRSDDRPEYARALAQRNALISRIRAGSSGRETLRSWDIGLARSAMSLMAGRASAVERVSESFATQCAKLGLAGEASLEYRPRASMASAEQLCDELAQRLSSDLERGFTTHGPHRDELALLRDGRALRTYASQGERRLALLALLLAEREALSEARRKPPLMLLDDVLSELDRERRTFLLGELLNAPGQSVIATTDVGELPSQSSDMRILRIRAGAIEDA